VQPHAAQRQRIILLGYPDTVIIEVTLDRHDDDVFERFGQALAELPEVMKAYLLTGEYDYLIKVAVAARQAAKNSCAANSTNCPACGIAARPSCCAA
jgi:DNA-binding Lrp family transcriptional regulator